MWQDIKAIPTDLEKLFFASKARIIIPEKITENPLDDLQKPPKQRIFFGQLVHFYIHLKCPQNMASREKEKWDQLLNMITIKSHIKASYRTSSEKIESPRSPRLKTQKSLTAKKKSNSKLIKDSEKNKTAMKMFTKSQDLSGDMGNITKHRRHLSDYRTNSFDILSPSKSERNLAKQIKTKSTREKKSAREENPAHLLGFNSETQIEKQNETHTEFQLSNGDFLIARSIRVVQNLYESEQQNITITAKIYFLENKQTELFGKLSAKELEKMIGISEKKAFGPYGPNPEFVIRKINKHLSVDFPFNLTSSFCSFGNSTMIMIVIENVHKNSALVLHNPKFHLNPSFQSRSPLEDMEGNEENKNKPIPQKRINSFLFGEAMQIQELVELFCVNEIPSKDKSINIKFLKPNEKMSLLYRISPVSSTLVDDRYLYFHGKFTSLFTVSWQITRQKTAMNIDQFMQFPQNISKHQIQWKKELVSDVQIKIKNPPLANAYSLFEVQVEIVNNGKNFREFQLKIPYSKFSSNFEQKNFQLAKKSSSQNDKKIFDQFQNNLNQLEIVCQENSIHLIIQAKSSVFVNLHFIAFKVGICDIFLELVDLGLLQRLVAQQSFKIQIC
ncbi:microtubule-associated protein [Anaeramoeba ignava]|uniref:Microtubule-associated protein n=1 Tax=Anaeramoeba ignava TaxID=1746090 RepID=A0A9Q0RIT6_ANAIG|nr:microtubule-associated protein [Anaeramoeba ignava]